MESFLFGLFCGGRGCWSRGAGCLFDRFRTDESREISAHQFRGLFDNGNVGRIAKDTINDFVAKLTVRIFATAILERELNLAAIRNEVTNVAQFHIVVVLFDVRVKLDFFLDGLRLILAGLLFLLPFIVTVLAEVHDTTNGRIGIRGNLNEVKMRFFGHANGITRIHHAPHAAIGENAANARNSDLVVGTDEIARFVVRAIGIVSDGKPLGMEC